ncbi:hypothetical protein KY343_01670 [Candidatus Woesearchaeota archaeon]|nr:hypothetical protein [Candidatus Woesearchaeota archaeon]
MKKIFILLGLVFLAVTAGCAKEKPIGGDTDEHGCLTAAGYQWCPSTEKCQRMWEEYCEEFSEQFREDLIKSFEDCVNAGFPIMESYPRKCKISSGETFVEEAEIMTEEETKEEPEVQGITAEELAKHDSFKDCWVVYEGKVYDVTDAPTHPNMPKTFWDHCGNLTSFEEAAKTRHGSRGGIVNYGLYIGELI